MKRIVAAGGIVINQLNEILFIYRYSKWDLPKGHLENGETMEECALREVKEETGLHNVSITRFIGKTQHEYFDNYLNAEAIKETNWFEMSGDKNEALQPLTQENIEWARWVSPKGVHFYLKNSYQNIIEIIKKSGLVMEH